MFRIFFQRMAVSVVFVATLSAAPAFGQSTASDLNRQIQLMRGIERYVDRLYLPNLQVLRMNADECLNEINKQASSSDSLDVLQRLQYLGLSFQHASGAFAEMSSDYLAPKIKEIHELMKRIQERHRLKRLEGSTIVKIIMDQIDRNVRLLQREKVLPAHTLRLTRLLDLLMDARSKGGLGDNEVTYLAGDAVYDWFKESASETDPNTGAKKQLTNREWLLQMTASDSLRITVEAILVQIESYARYARMDEAKRIRGGKAESEGELE